MGLLFTPKLKVEITCSLTLNCRNIMNSIVITSRVAELDFRRPARLQRARGELSLESLSLVTPTVPLSRRPKTKHIDYIYQ